MNTKIKSICVIFQRPIPIYVYLDDVLIHIYYPGVDRHATKKFDPPILCSPGSKIRVDPPNTYYGVIWA